MISNAAPVETTKFGFLAKHERLCSLKSRRGSYAAAMGGKLQLVAEFRNRHPVAIALADIAGAAPLKPTRRIRAGLPAA